MANFSKSVASVLDEDDCSIEIFRGRDVDGNRSMMMRVRADGLTTREYPLSAVSGSKSFPAHVRLIVRQYLADEGFAQA